MLDAIAKRFAHVLANVAFTRPVSVWIAASFWKLHHVDFAEGVLRSGTMGKPLGRTALDVVYDGQCSFCRRSLAFLERLAGRTLFRLYDASDRVMIQSKFPAIPDLDTN